MSFTVYAEMAKEGRGDYKSAKSGTIEVLAMGKERLQMNFEELGVVVGAPENCPFHNASFRDMGSLHAINGKYEANAFLEYTYLNGDKVYAATKSEGVLGSGVSSGTAKLVGGKETVPVFKGRLNIKVVRKLNRPKKAPKVTSAWARSVGKYLEFYTASTVPKAEHPLLCLPVMPTASTAGVGVAEVCFKIPTNPFSIFLRNFFWLFIRSLKNG